MAIMVGLVDSPFLCLGARARIELKKATSSCEHASSAGSESHAGMMEQAFPGYSQGHQMWWSMLGTLVLPHTRVRLVAWLHLL